MSIRVLHRYAGSRTWQKDLHGICTERVQMMEANMAFVTDKTELKPGLIIFRRGDVDHRMWYCRMKMPKADRYKTVSLKTTDIDVARDRVYAPEQK